jgi:Ca2+-binding EF-hand superfamily protein
VCGRDPKIAAATAGADMNEQRPPKKTEMIEVRVSMETKRDFLEACRTAGRSASDVIREGMQAFIDGQAKLEAATSDPAVVSLKERVLKKRYLAVAVAATGIAGLAALPSAAAPDLAGMFARLDLNGDGVLSNEEFSASRSDARTMAVRKLERASGKATAAPDKPMMLIIPADGDGKALDGLRDVRFQAIGTGALAAKLEEVKQRSFAAFDSDGDGRISLKEYQARQKLLLTNGFERLDKDGDGAVTAAEYAAIGQPLLLTAVGADPILGVAGKYGPIATTDSIDANFARLDSNKDGKLSLQEYLPSK